MAGIQPGGSVRIHISEDEKETRLCVADTGIGIPKEDVERIFDRFYRVDKARSRERGGTGLGLAITKEIVEHHGGTISVESELSVGTTVRICLDAKAQVRHEN